MTREPLEMRVTNGGSVSLGALQLFSGDEPALQNAISRLVQSRDAHLIVTPNVDQVLDLHDSPSLRAAFESASLRIIDGMPLVALSKLLGAGQVHRHTGADLLPKSASWAKTNGWTIAITGGDTRVCDLAATRLRNANPGAAIESIAFPFIKDVGDPASRQVIEDLSAVDPDIVFLCLGAPKQEEWYMHWRHRLPPAVYIGAGAAVDFAAGSRSRAPKLMQRIGLEWIWRLSQEPQRLAHRYLVKGPRFLKYMATSIVRRNK